MSNTQMSPRPQARSVVTLLQRCAVSGRRIRAKAVTIDTDATIMRDNIDSLTETAKSWEGPNGEVTPPAALALQAMHARAKVWTQTAADLVVLVEALHKDVAAQAALAVGAMHTLDCLITAIAESGPIVHTATTGQQPEQSDNAGGSGGHGNGNISSTSSPIAAPMNRTTRGRSLSPRKVCRVVATTVGNIAVGPTSPVRGRVAPHTTSVRSPLRKSPSKDKGDGAGGVHGGEYVGGSGESLTVTMPSINMTMPPKYAVTAKLAAAARQAAAAELRASVSARVTAESSHDMTDKDIDTNAATATATATATKDSKTASEKASKSGSASAAKVMRPRPTSAPQQRRPVTTPSATSSTSSARVKTKRESAAAAAGAIMSTVVPTKRPSSATLASAARRAAGANTSTSSKAMATKTPKVVAGTAASAAAVKAAAKKVTGTASVGRSSPKGGVLAKGSTITNSHKPTMTTTKKGVAETSSKAMNVHTTTATTSKASTRGAGAQARKSTSSLLAHKASSVSKTKTKAKQGSKSTEKDESAVINQSDGPTRVHDSTISDNSRNSVDQSQLKETDELDAGADIDGGGDGRTEIEPLAPNDGTPMDAKSMMDILSQPITQSTTNEITDTDTDTDIDTDTVTHTNLDIGTTPVTSVLVDLSETDIDDGNVTNGDSVTNVTATAIVEVNVDNPVDVSDIEEVVDAQHETISESIPDVACVTTTCDESDVVAVDENDAADIPNGTAKGAPADVASSDNDGIAKPPVTFVDMN